MVFIVLTVLIKKLLQKLNKYDLKIIKSKIKNPQIYYNKIISYEKFKKTNEQKKCLSTDSIIYNNFNKMTNNELLNYRLNIWFKKI